jgi:hypothetical protein
MKMPFCLIAAVALTLPSTTNAGPAARDPGVNTRQREQHHRVAQGTRSGQLTAAERKDVAKEQQAIRKEEREFKSDGKLTIDERKELQKDLNQASKNIYEQKHDAEVRPSTTSPRDPFVNGRQAVQQGRIAEGVKSGELTRPEAARLYHQQQVIRREERVYKAEGKLTPAERKDLHQDLNKTSSDIYKQKHDAQSR